MSWAGIMTRSIGKTLKLSALASAIAILLLNCSCSMDNGTAAGHSQSSETAPVVTASEADQVITLTMFSSTLGKEKAEDNEIRELIAEKTGVKVIEIWQTGQYSRNVFDGFLESKNLADFMYFSERLDEFYEAGLLVAWDPYIEQYPNIKSLYTDEEWDMLRQADGHIYSVSIPDAPVWTGTSEEENVLCNTAGFTVTTCCKNPDIAFKFINDILTEEIMDYRFWGIEGVDYLVDADGNCYRTQEMTENWSDVDYGIKHVCQYLMMPQS